MRDHKTYRAYRRNEARKLAREIGKHISRVFQPLYVKPLKAKKKAD